MRRLIVAALIMVAVTPVCFAQPGRIVDAATGAGIADATVTLGERILHTDADGRFQGDATTAPVRARAPGYRSATVAATEFWRGDATMRLAPFRPKALYLSFYGIGSQTIREAALSLIHDAKLNALVIDVKGDRGWIAYRSGVPLGAAVGAQRIITIPDLPALLRSLHEAGIYAIARIVGSGKVLAAVAAGVDPREVTALWRSELSAFEAVRARYLLYPN